jgi:hypothetical protein
VATHAVLTTGSTIACGHPLPGAPVGGLVELPVKQQVLTIDGKIVLVDTLKDANIQPGCAQTPKTTNPPVQPCSIVASQAGQGSSVLTVDGTPVLLHPISGTSDGIPLTDWSSTDAGQAVLTAD